MGNDEREAVSASLDKLEYLSLGLNGLAAACNIMGGGYDVDAPTPSEQVTQAGFFGLSWFITDIENRIDSEISKINAVIVGPDKGKK